MNELLNYINNKKEVFSMKTVNPTPAVSRRKFIGASATTAVGITALTLPISNNADAVSPRFSHLKALKPPPTTISGTTTAPPLASLVLNKAAFGPRPSDIDAFNALGGDDTSRITAWVDQQLNPTASDPDLDSRLTFLSSVNAYDTINKSALQLWADHARDDDYLIRNRPRWQMERLMIFRGVYSQWQLREMLNDFWFNHFNVKGSSFPTQGMLPHYNEELRSRMFGNFYDMLEANSRTASMLFYLDNYRNSWPNPNENYAREVLELHTLGAIENYYGAVDPNTLGNNIKGQRTGYTEIDVFQFARALTGWSIADGNGGSADTGEFLFRSDQHYDEHGTESIKVLDVDIATDGGENDVTDILQYLANHFGTARFIAWKLCTRFVGDSPPESLVASTAEEFYSRRNDNDQLKEVYRHILMSPEFRNTWGAKVKRPLETIISAMRATEVDIDFRNDHSPSDSIYYRLDETGQEPYDNDTPTGYPDEKPLWSGSGPLVSTWRTITYFLNRSGDTYDDPDTGEIGRIRYCNLAEQANTEIPNTANRTPTQLVDMWMIRLRGYSYDSATRTRLITYVSDKSGATANQSLHDVTDTDNLSNNSTYQRVIYTLVGLILMSPDAMRR
jgi:uncharacterized protein (DUF1800 family)